MDIFRQTEHRPYPLPRKPWALHMVWAELLFMHWPVPAASLAALIPSPLRLETFEGSAWLGIVPFEMQDVRPRYLPSVPGLSDFPELNVRTYVTHDDKPGVWFFSLDAHNKVAVRMARAAFHLPYFDAEMSLGRDLESLHYKSERTHKGAARAIFEARYAASEPVLKDELTAFLTERYCLYSMNPSGTVFRGDIHHLAWPLKKAELELYQNDMTQHIDLDLPDIAPLLHYAKRLEVKAWLPVPISAVYA